MAITSLVLGILAWVACSILAGIPAIICGHIGRSRISASNGQLGGSGLALAGLILGYLSIVPAILIACFFVVGAGVAVTKAPQIQQAIAAPTVHSMAPRIAAACNRYRADKGKYPPATVVSGEQVDSAELFAILTDKSNGDPYYDPSGNGIHINGTPADPWGEALQVAIDLNGDGKVDVNGTLVDGTVVVWSKGANKQNEFGQGDDVKSWAK